MRPTPVLYCGATGPYEDSARQAWSAMSTWLEASRRPLALQRGFGLIHDHCAAVEPIERRYEACVELLPGLSADPENGIVRRVTPSGAYALARLKGCHRQIGEGFRRLRERWSESGSIVIDVERPCMAIYLNDPATTPDEELLTQICVPVWLPIRVGKRRRIVPMIRA